MLKFTDVVVKDIAQAFATTLTTMCSLFLLKEIVMSSGLGLGIAMVIGSAPFFSGHVDVTKLFGDDSTCEKGASATSKKLKVFDTK